MGKKDKQNAAESTPEKNTAQQPDSRRGGQDRRDRQG